MKTNRGLFLKNCAKDWLVLDASSDTKWKHLVYVYNKDGTLLSKYEDGKLQSQERKMDITGYTVSFWQGC